MLAKVALLISLGQVQGQVPTTQVPAKVSAGELISKAMVRYLEASTLSGTIKTVQEAKGVSIAIDTDIQFDRGTSRIYLRQGKGGSDPREFLLVSNGKEFTFDRPMEALGQSRFREWVTQDGRTQTVELIYGAAIKSLLERSAALDLLVGREPDLRDLRDHMGTKSITQTMTVNRKPAYVVDGAWHDMPGAEATGTFRMVLTEDGDLLKMVKVQRYRVPDKIKETLLITTTWTVNVQVNGKVDDRLFTVK